MQPPRLLLHLVPLLLFPYWLVLSKGALSPQFFSTSTSKIHHPFSHQSRASPTVGTVKHHGQLIGMLAYADDLVLIAKDGWLPQQLLDAASSSA